MAIASVCTWVQAQSDTNINPLNVARAFALKTPAYFVCQLQGQALISNSWQSVEMKFVVRKGDFGITNLTIGDTHIPLPEPIYGLPLGDGGIIRNVYVNATAVTKSDEYAGNGWVQLPQVTKDDHIQVVLHPADVRIEIPVDVGLYGNDIRLDIENFIYGWGYGVSGDKFYVYLPPVGGRYHYILRRWSTGEPIGEGYIEPFRATVTPDNAYFGVRYIGNVIEAEFNTVNTDEWIGVPNLGFDCSIPTTAGTNVFGKVIFVDVGSGGLELVIGADVWVYVQRATSTDGDMPFLALEDHSVTNQWYTETRLNTVQPRVGKVVITIVPKSSVDKLWLNLHRFYGLPSSSTTPISGGGKSGPTPVVPSTIEEK